MKKEEIEQKVNEVEEISDCVLYENGTAKEVPMVKNMELEEQEELIDWVIEKINERQNVMKDNKVKIVMSGSDVDVTAPVILLQHIKEED